MHRRCLSRRGAGEGGLCRGLARAAHVERRRHPVARRASRSSRAPSCPAIPTTRRRATSRPRSKASSSAASTCPTAIRSPARSSTTSSPGSSGCTAHARKLLREDVPVVLAGDYNVAPTDIDIYPTTSWDDDALIQPQSRAAYARLVKQGWTDALREAASRRARLHVLALHAQPLAAQRRAAPRPSAAQPRPRAAPRSGRRRSRRARQAGRQRPRAGVDRTRHAESACAPPQLVGNLGLALGRDAGAHDGLGQIGRAQLDEAIRVAAQVAAVAHGDARGVARRTGPWRVEQLQAGVALRRRRRSRR